jgi:hypothetical protein
MRCPNLPDPDHAARVEAYKQKLDELKTQLLPQTELARFLGCDRHKVPTILRHVPGVEWIGTRARVPLFAMPPLYFLENGLLDPASKKTGLPRRTKKHHPRKSSKRRPPPAADK